MKTAKDARIKSLYNRKERIEKYFNEDFILVAIDKAIERGETYYYGYWPFEGGTIKDLEYFKNLPIISLLKENGYYVQIYWFDGGIHLDIEWE